MRPKPRAIVIAFAAAVLAAGGVSAPGNASSGPDETRASIESHAADASTARSKESVAPRYCIDPSGNPYPCHAKKKWAKKHKKKFKKGKLGRVKRFQLDIFKHPPEGQAKDKTKDPQALQTVRAAYRRACAVDPRGT